MLKRIMQAKLLTSIKKGQICAKKILQLAIKLPALTKSHFGSLILAQPVYVFDFGVNNSGKSNIY